MILTVQCHWKVYHYLSLEGWMVINLLRMKVERSSPDSEPRNSTNTRLTSGVSIQALSSMDTMNNTQCTWIVTQSPLLVSDGYKDITCDWFAQRQNQLENIILIFVSHQHKFTFLIIL